MNAADSDQERYEFTAEELEYLRKHRRDLETWVSEGRFQYWVLVLAFVLGLAADAVGYVLQTSTTGEPIGFIADLIYGLGLALWTGVVVAFFIQVFPEVKRRQIKRYLDAFDATTKASRAKPSSGP